MEQTTILNISSIFVASLSFGVAFCSFVYSIKTNTKIYELTVRYRNDILLWYSQVIEATVLLRHIVEIENYDKIKKNETLAKLSGLIEKGRFFYPNVDIGDSYGKDKPAAYRGYRSIPLEFLVYFYEVAKKEDAKKYKQHLYFLERHFTSYIFENLDPVGHNKNSCKIVKIKYDNNTNLESFLRQEPMMENIFRILD